jgi:Ner family transcriptional regulator
MRHVRYVTKLKLAAFLRAPQQGTSAQSPRAPHPEQIKGLIRMRGVTMTGLCRSWGYSESCIRQTLKRPSPRIEQLIAEFLGVKPQFLWPDRYDAKGKPVRGRSVKP